MSTKTTKRLVREGDFVAEVDVDLLEAEGGWAPYLIVAITWLGVAVAQITSWPEQDENGNI